MLLISRHNSAPVIGPDDETSSFVIRSPLGGSGLRDPASSTNRLRNDPELTPGVLAQLLAGSSIVADALSYSSVQLSWQAPSIISGWTELLIVSSTFGSPVTPLTGRQVVRVPFADPTNTYIDTGLVPGYWRYYSMFLRVPSSNPQYILVARTGALLPAKLAWDEQLWDNTPGWYRRLDSEVGGDSDGPLRRFYSLLGFELDRSVTFADGIRDVYDIDTVAESLLPSIAKQLGVPVEPDIGGDRFRSYIANFSAITRRKATSAGAALLIKSMTGCDSSVSVGKNLLLTPQDANGSTYDGVNSQLGIGGWIGNDSNSIVVPGFGSDYIRCATAGSGSLNVSDWIFNAFYSGVPVTEGNTYTLSGIVRAAATGRVCTLSIVWYGNESVLISTSSAATFTDTTAALGSQPVRSVTAVAPDGALYAVPQVSWAGCAAFEEHELHKLQFELGGAATTWQAPRLITLTVESQRINLCLNPSLAGTLASPPSSWVFGNGTAAVTTDAGAISGTTVCVVTATATGDVSATNSTAWPVTGGDFYSWSIDAKTQDSVPALVNVLWYDVNNVLLPTSTQYPVIVTNSSAFVALSSQAQAPANAATAKLQVVMQSVTVGHTATLDACMIEQGQLGSYFDGDSTTGGSTDFQWEGAQFVTRSHYVANRLAVMSRLTAALGDFMPIGSTWVVATNPAPS